jgi:hypothetical protein
MVGIPAAYLLAFVLRVGGMVLDSPPYFPTILVSLVFDSMLIVWK